jgi:hypothetical protein
MKLKQFRVREFRSIWDSGPIEVNDQTTCFVGKNEAGKTTILTALYRAHPIRKTDAVFDETYDYPKREVEDYRFAVEKGERKEAEVVECIYELNKSDLLAVEDVFGPNVLKSTTFKRTTYYGRSNSRYTLSCDDAAARQHLAKNPALSDDLRSTLQAASNWQDFAAALDIVEATDAVNSVKTLVAKVREKDLS